MPSGGGLLILNNSGAVHRNPEIQYNTRRYIIYYYFYYYSREQMYLFNPDNFLWICQACRSQGNTHQETLLLVQELNIYINEEDQFSGQYKDTYAFISNDHAEFWSLSLE